MYHPSISKTGRVFFAPILYLFIFLGNHYPKLLVKLRYYYLFKKPLDLKNPQGLNEKILWAKLYSDTKEWTRLADKYLVREYIKSLGLDEILVNLYAVWYKVDDVDFDSLPDKFIIKANNGDGKGTNRIINKQELNKTGRKECLSLIKTWLNRKNIGALSAEPHYKLMQPCVIAEELLPYDEGESSMIDYKIWCFNGKASHIYVCSERSQEGNGVHVMTYDLEWNAHPEYSIFTKEYPRGKIMSKPQNLNKMIEVAEKLSQNFPELRVDLYNINGKIYFGELTFTSLGGLMSYFTPEFNLELGKKVDMSLFKLK